MSQSGRTLGVATSSERVIERLLEVVPADAPWSQLPAELSRCLEVGVSVRLKLPGQSICIERFRTNRIAET